MRKTIGELESRRVLACTGLHKGFIDVKNISMGELVTDLVSQSLRVLLLLTYKEEPWRLVTFETLDQIDEET